MWVDACPVSGFQAAAGVVGVQSQTALKVLDIPKPTVGSADGGGI